MIQVLLHLCYETSQVYVSANNGYSIKLQDIDARILYVVGVFFGGNVFKDNAVLRLVLKQNQRNLSNYLESIGKDPSRFYSRLP